MPELTGWLFDLYADPCDGLVTWWIAADGSRCRLRQPFPVTFYIAGPEERLRQAEQFLRGQSQPLELERGERRDLFVPGLTPVLGARVLQAEAQPGLFQKLSRAFPELTYYDADLPLTLRYAAACGASTLSYCRVAYSAPGRLECVEALDTPWDLDPPQPPLRTLVIEPDVDPAHRRPRFLNLLHANSAYRLALQPARPLLVNLRSLLDELDPDLLLTAWGDTWLLRCLLDLSEQTGLPLPLNREAGRGVIHRGERTYFSYGQVIHRGEQIHLYGRWHIDRCNAMLWGDYGLEGVLEMGRVTSLPVQTAARVSPGTGISSMQILTALRQGVLVPWHKQQAESLRPATDLFYADQGGLVYQPLVGLHRDVAEVDFISMYPSIMVHFNISPETVGSQAAGAEEVPWLGLKIDRSYVGLIPQTLKPLLDKRIALKARLAELAHWHPSYARYKVCAAAHKWLLVTCFGYLGYRNARFGRIESHQAVTAYGREALLQAKEAAEEQGFTVLHLYVDGMWACRPGAKTVAEFQPLLDEIAGRTGLPIALDGIYRWVVFLPSRQNDTVPVANRYYGVFQDGSLKVRGIEARRLDTPPFIARLQMQMLERLSQAPDADHLPEKLPELLGMLRRAAVDLRRGRLRLEDCLVTQKLSRKLEEYRTPSPVAKAVAQLRAVGREMRPGQRVRFLFLRGEPGVQAWDLPEPPQVQSLDVARYQVLLVRAASTIFQPFGIAEETLRSWLVSGAVAVELPSGYALPSPSGRVNSPEGCGSNLTACVTASSSSGP